MKLTIFTPTYNRAYSLTRLYNSLLSQSNYDFEWLIVDDGSSDNTEEVIQQLINASPPFEIRYMKQNHMGKPSAQNAALDVARGEFFITCDSNKYMDSQSVSNIIYMAQTIQSDPMICGVGGYRADFSGNIYGGEMLLEGREYIDCSMLECEKYHLTGDKSTAFRTEILKNYKSPIFPGETFVTEGVWLLKIASDGYKIRWFPIILCYGEYAKDGLTAAGANSYKGHYENFYGFLAFINICMKVYETERVEAMLIEAADIAKSKKTPLAIVADNSGCSVTFLKKLILKHKFVTLYNASKQLTKKIIGKKASGKIKKFIYGKPSSLQDKKPKT